MMESRRVAAWRAFLKVARALVAWVAFAIAFERVIAVAASSVRANIASMPLGAEVAASIEREAACSAPADRGEGLVGAMRWCQLAGPAWWRVVWVPLFMVGSFRLC